MGIQVVQIKGWPLLGPNKGQNKDNFNKSSKKDKVPRVMYGPTPGA